jgi:hypothetical protein
MRNDTPSRPIQRKARDSDRTCCLGKESDGPLQRRPDGESDKTATLTRARAFKPLVEIVLEEHRR